MPDPSLRPRSGRSAKALLLTILGEFALGHGGEIWTSTIIDGLGRLDVEERNARQAAARLSDQGILRSERIGRVARWRLTDDGRRLLDEGSERIYRFPSSALGWDHRWLVVLASVAEDERAKRLQLRSRLGFAGFGFLAPSVAVSPHVAREGAANAVLRHLALEDTAVVLLAETGSLVPDEEIIRRAWDLDDLAQRYRDFITRFEGLDPRADGDRFAAVVELVHEWRRFPFEDPEIPAELLPDGWPGTSAKEVFDTCHSAWSRSAAAWYAAVEAAGGPG